MKLEVVLAAIDKATKPIKSVLGSTTGLSKQLQETRNRLKELDRQQSTLEKFKDTSRGLAVAKTQLQRAAEKLDTLKKELAATEHPTKKLTDAIRIQQAETDKLRLRHGKLYAQSVQLQQGLKDYGLETRNLTAQQKRLKAEAEALNPVLEQQKNKLLQLNKLQSARIASRARYEKALETRDRIAGAGAGMMAAGATTGAALTVPVSAYAQAEDAAMQLRVSMMGKGGQVRKEYAEIVALAEKLGNRLPGTTADFQEMMTVLTRQGMSAKAILGGVGEASAYLGVQLKLPFAQAAEYAAQMQDATGALEKDMMGVMDTIQRTYQVGVDPSNMVSGFAKLTPVLDMIRQKGLAGAQTLAPLLAMADQAKLVGESAGNAYRKVFQRSMDADKIAKGNKLAKAAGIKFDFTDGKGEFGGLDKMFNQLAQLKKLNTQQRNAVINEIWGDDAETLHALNIMMEKGQAGYREMQQKMADQASLQERVNTQLGTLKNLWDAATGTFTNAMVRFGEAIAPELKALTEWIATASEKLGDWAKANPALANTLMKVAGISAIALTALGGLAVGIAGVLGPFLALRFALSMTGIQFGSMLPKIGEARASLQQLLPSLSGIQAGASNTASTLRTTLANAWTAANPRTAAASLRDYAIALRERVPLAMARARLATAQLWGSTRLWLLGVGSSMKTSLASAGTAVAAYTRKVWLAVVAQRAALASRWQGFTSYAGKAGVAGMGKDALKGSVNLVKAGAVSSIRGAGTALMGLGRVILFVGRLAMMNPIGLALGAAAFLVLKYWQPIKAWFGGFWQGLTTGLAPLGALFRTTFASLGNALAPLKPAWDWFVGVLGTVWGWISKMFAPINATNQSLAAASASGQGFGQVLASMITVAAKLLAAFLELPGKFVTLGVNIMEGLGLGIMRLKDWVLNSVGGIASDVAKRFKSILGIHSPSRVFAQLGGWTMEGLGIGMDKGSSGPLAAIQTLAGQLVGHAKKISLPAVELPALSGGIANGFSLDGLRDIAGKLTAAGAGIAIGTASAAPAVSFDTRPPIGSTRAAPQQQAVQPITINVYATPGMNEQQLVRLMKQTLEAHQQQQARGRRSRLSDED